MAHVPATQINTHGNYGTTRFIPTSDLTVADESVLSMGITTDTDVDGNSHPTIDANPLYHTGIWSWMLAELVLAGPGQLVMHRPHHDLESMFYVLLSLCIFLKEPHKPQTEDELAKCFDKYFNTYEPSLLKTTTIQSNISWGLCIVHYISPYFHCFIPLLERLHKDIIVPMHADADGTFHRDKPIIHDTVIVTLIDALCSLDDSAWEPYKDLNEPNVPGPPVVASDQESDGSGESIRHLGWDEGHEAELVIAPGPADSLADSSHKSDSAHELSNIVPDLPPEISRPHARRVTGGHGFHAQSDSAVYSSLAQQRQLEDDLDERPRHSK
ncbi:hypothetical protein BDN67DRAFT_1014226 [Paxillus ammoniavirescens]|nr:hypothetical protein BDN67DRAFT_1014226 [Paxillus ammoniavirescens]